MTPRIKRKDRLAGKETKESERLNWSSFCYITLPAKWWCLQHNLRSAFGFKSSTMWGEILRFVDASGRYSKIGIYSERKTTNLGVPQLTFSMYGDFARGKDTVLPTWLIDWVEEAYDEISDMYQSLSPNRHWERHETNAPQSLLKRPLTHSPMYLLAQGTISTPLQRTSHLKCVSCLFLVRHINTKKVLSE